MNSYVWYFLHNAWIFPTLSFAVGGSLNAGPQKPSRSWTINSKKPGAYLQRFPNVHFELHAQSMLVNVSLSTAFLCSLSFGFLTFNSALLVAFDWWGSFGSSAGDLKSLRNEPNHSITRHNHHFSSPPTYLISHHIFLAMCVDVTAQWGGTRLGIFFTIQNRNSRHSTQVSKSLFSIHICS